MSPGTEPLPRNCLPLCLCQWPLTVSVSKQAGRGHEEGRHRPRLRKFSNAQDYRSAGFCNTEVPPDEVGCLRVISFSARLSVLRDTTRLGTPLVVSSPGGLLTVRDNPSNQCSNAKVQLQARAGDTT